MQAITRNVSTWTDLIDPIIPDEATGRWYSSSRLLSENDILPGKSRDGLIDALVSMREFEPAMYCYLIAFGGIISNYIPQQNLVSLYT